MVFKLSAFDGDTGRCPYQQLLEAEQVSLGLQPVGTKAVSNQVGMDMFWMPDRLPGKPVGLLQKRRQQIQPARESLKSRLLAYRVPARVRLQKDKPDIARL